MPNSHDLCPLCNSPLNEIEETKSGKKLQRCSTSSWNPQTKQSEGCTFVRWINENQKVLKEKCPKCGSSLVLQKTRTGKKMKKCITSGWDKENMVATGCDYIEWIDKSKKQLKEECPMCGNPLVEMKTKSGKKMKKCSTAGWDPEFRQPTGCTYIEWIN
jgi:hypothetical protein